MERALKIQAIAKIYAFAAAAWHDLAWPRILLVVGCGVHSGTTGRCGCSGGSLLGATGGLELVFEAGTNIFEIHHVCCYYAQVIDGLLGREGGRERERKKCQMRKRERGGREKGREKSDEKLHI